jgi:hypothetical protein
MMPLEWTTFTPLVTTQLTPAVISWTSAQSPLLAHFIEVRVPFKPQILTMSLSCGTYFVSWEQLRPSSLRQKATAPGLSLAPLG